MGLCQASLSANHDTVISISSVTNKQLFSLQFCGPECMNNAKGISMKVIHETGGTMDVIHCSDNAEMAASEINNLFNFVNMQIGL